MKRSLTIVSGICLSMSLLSSCIVSKKKYDAETQRAEKEKAEKIALGKQLDEQIALNKKLNATNTDLNNTVAALNARIGRLRDSISNNESAIRDLTNKVNVLGDEKESTKRQLRNTRDQVDEQRKRLEQLQALLDQQKQAAEALRSKIAEALKGFNSSELTVKMKNGKVYISMQESLLFPSGSAVVNPKGKEALSKVAGVLNTSSDININIEGHTDSIPIRTAKFADNWELSTARATSIAHVLIDDYHVVPAKLVASGRSEYDPIAPNSTPEGRGQNRRTEIILEPKLNELMKLMGE
ncbi:OmpA family protein [Nemorincola caseinilytica]|uniref:OmpA family protein n=1 Tax=Nemorincola caseinilytica TaxID=2054315 RepID=A0ABP8N6X5_9BACT